MIEFFQDTTVRDLVQGTIEEVTALEEREQKKLLRSFKNVRRELQDRLLTIPEGTFSEQQLNITLAQVHAAIIAMKIDLKKELKNSSEVLANKGLSDLIREISKLSKRFEGAEIPLNINQILLAHEAQNFLLQKHESSLDAYSEGLRSQIFSNITQSMITRETTQRTVSRMQNDIGKFFIGEEWKLNRIARTELHNIYNFAKLSGMQDTQKTQIPDLKKTLMHPMDHRTGDDSKDLAQNNPIIELDEPFVHKYKGKTFTFLWPPQRPNDRAVVVSYRDSWGKNASLFRTTKQS